MIVQNRHQKPLHPLSHQHQEVEMRREKRSLRGRSRSGKSNRQPCKNFLKGTCTKLPCDHWHPPECQFYRSESGCKFGAECSFPHWKVKEQPNKRPKKGGDKSAVTTLKDLRQLGCVSLSILRKSTKILGPIRRLRFTKVTQRHANIRESKGPSLNKMQVKSSHQRSPSSVKFEDRSQEETERQERCAGGDAWKLAQHIFYLKETKNYILFAFR